MLWTTLLFLSIIAVLFCREQAVRNRFSQQLQQDEAAYYEKLSLVLQQTTALQHDIKNHLYVLDAHLNAGDYTEAKSYLQKLLLTAPFSFPHVSSPDKTLSAILSVKLYQCENARIPFDCRISFTHIYQLQPFDMTTIFTNLLDNAIAACRSVKRPRRYIRLSVAQADTYLYITCENARTKNPADFCRTASFHGNRQGTAPSISPGMGIQNIKKALKAYNGTIEIEKGSQNFSVTILLPNHPF